MANDRYGSMPGCSSQISTNIKSYFSALKNYDSSRRSLFQEIYTDLEALEKSNNQLNSNMLSYSDEMKKFKNSIQSLIYEVADPKKGIVNSFNCLFLKSNFRRMHDSICVKFLTPVFQMTVLVSVCAFSVFLGSLMAFLLGWKSGKEFNYKLKMKNTKVMPL